MPLVGVAVAVVILGGALEAGLWTLAGLCLTALAWIAYKHPKSYARIYPWLAGSQLILLVALGTYSISHQVGWHDATVAAGPLNVPPWEPPFASLPVIGGIVGFSLVNMLFVFLHQILGLTQDDVQQQQTRDD